MKYIIDTNVLVAIVLHGTVYINDKEEEVVNKVASLIPSELVIPDFVLTEFALVMQKVILRRFGYDKNGREVKNLNEKYILLLKHLNLVLIPYMIKSAERQQALNLFSDALRNNQFRRGITYADCLLVSIAKSNDFELLTLEKDLLKLLGVEK